MPKKIEQIEGKDHKLIDKRKATLSKGSHMKYKNHKSTFN